MRKIETFSMIRRWSLIGLSSLFLVAPVWAAEGGGESGSLFAGDLGNMIWTLVIFVILLVVLGKFAWGPVLNGLQSREQFIFDSLAKAKEERDLASAKLAEYEEKLAQARSEVEEIVDEARRDAAVLRQREEEKAQEEAQKTLERAKREIEIAKDTAVKDLYSRATSLTVDAASRILKRELTPNDHEQLIAESIAAIEKINPN
ncbi:MAG: F0F1 ATP synthase subunit B [Acidobacteriota bacterium]